MKWPTLIKVDQIKKNQETYETFFLVLN